jgi:hypothetical protein
MPKAPKNNGVPTPQKRGVKTRKRNAKLTQEAFRRGRRQGWKDVIHAYETMDGDAFQDWLFTVTGHEG